MCCGCFNKTSKTGHSSSCQITWKYRPFLIFLGVLQLLLAIIIALTEFANELQDFWYTNVFGGFWTSGILFVNTIVLFISVCCNCSAACFLFWNITSILALCVLIGFNIAFLIDPSTCLLPLSTCTSQTTLDSFHYVIPPLANYTQADAKRLYRYIQIGSVGVALILSLLFLVFYCYSRQSRKVNPLESRSLSNTTKTYTSEGSSLPPIHPAHLNTKEQDINKLNGTIERQNTHIVELENELTAYKKKLPPLPMKKKTQLSNQDSKDPPSIENSTTTKVKKPKKNADKDSKTNEAVTEWTAEPSEYVKLQLPKSSQLPPWSIAGPTIGQIFCAPPPY